MTSDSQPLDGIQSDLDARLIAERVRNLFERKGITKRRHAATICEYLHLSPSQAHRKIKGESPWTLAQIREIASAFNVAPAELFQEVDDFDNLNYIGQRSVLMVGNDELTCIAQIGGEVTTDAPSTLFVALRIGEQWCVYRTGQAPAGKQYQVEKIEIDGRRPMVDKPIIAILDDNSNAADELSRSLQKRDFSTVPFYSIDALLAAMERTRFGGFILDWMIGSETARRCIEAIRVKHNIDSPIIILTAYMGHAGHATAIAEMMTIHKIIGPYEKPARAPVIAAALKPYCTR
ncbi:helix-turn-helix domain-containing protein [Burkholderia ubonensis]|uniref:Histidine kinase n=1 Tax=Burkholderia ubonensis TaxID=101571 RepID=A0ABD4DWS3_9BURK|nr:helix-turn-helix domain-containing protein [Burkholderia ubonensis]KVN77270.1 histidine kinase [Burkholderia ubonensis]KVZ49037.1 histidine kinase [Burkholderia ubonensis]KVZ76520.1 histidine kinase [Burkholderia ubonensis]